MRYTDDSFSIRGRSHGSHIRRNREFDYDEGHVVTPYGIVGVYAQGGGMDQNYSSLSFALNGRQHTRTYRKQRLTVRGLVTAATRFAREITEAA